MADQKAPTLASFYQVITPKDLIGGFDAHKPLDERTSSIHEKAMDLIVNSDRLGAYTAQQMVAQVTEFAKGADAEPLNDVLQIYSDVDPPSGAEYGKVDGTFAKISSTVKGQESCPSKMAVVFSNSPFVSLNVRHLNQVTLFLTTIPSVELSRAVPFLDVNFQFDRPAVSDGEEKNQIPSLIRFLEGAVKSDMASSKKMMKAYETTLGTAQISEVDMSLFTSPQTLVNPGLDPSNAGNPVAAEIADKYRPLASLLGIQIDVVASPSYTVAYKSMKMDIILHDRTRLAEVADMICPASYTGKTMSIRYGWSHPDDPRTNPYSELINQMVCQERYAINNASYSFDEVGQVKVTLNLNMMGENQLWISRISENSTYRKVQTQIEEIKNQLFNLMQTLGVDIEPTARGYQILDHLDVGSSAGVITDEFKAEVDKFTAEVKKKAGNGPNKEVAMKLADLLDGTVKKAKEGSITGLKEELKRSLSQAMLAKMDILRNAPDPWLPADDDKKVPYAGDLKAKKARTVNKGQKTMYSYSSLAKVMAAYIQQPLQLSNMFEEVQIIFYPFNDYCGKASGTNIGSFPIQIERLKKVLDKALSTRGPTDMSVGEFGKLLNDAIISDPGSLAFGLGRNYIYDKDDKPKLKPNTNIGKEQADLQGDSAWQNPSIELYLECLNKAPEASSKKLDRGATGLSQPGTILRIHVFDRLSTPWDGFMKLKNSLGRLQTSISAAKSQNGKTSIQQIKKALDDSKLNKQLQLADASIEVDEASGQIKVNKFNVAKMKKMISSFVPTFIYGANNTGLFNASVQTGHDPKLSAANMIRTDGGSTTSPNGQGVAGLPLRVIPGTISVSTFGCPLLQFNQQFFIDFGTNTDLDNFYTLVGLSHFVGPGKFETQARFAWADAYGSYENIARRFTAMSAKIKDHVK